MEKQEEEAEDERDTKIAKTLIVLKRDNMLADKSLNLTPQHQQCSVWPTMQRSKTIVNSKQSSNINSINMHWSRLVLRQESPISAAQLGGKSQSIF